MAVVGPSGFQKTELFFSINQRENFLSQSWKSLFFKDIQPIIREKINACNIQTEFIKFDGFDRLRNIENILLVFDDSYEKNYNDREFIKLATAERHKGLGVFYFKHNLFQQSRWSRTFDLNTSHIVLFKSPCDIQ